MKNAGTTAGQAQEIVTEEIIMSSSYRGSGTPGGQRPGDGRHGGGSDRYRSERPGRGRSSDRAYRDSRDYRTYRDASGRSGYQGVSGQESSYRGTSGRSGSYKDMRRKERTERAGRTERMAARPAGPDSEAYENPNRLEGKNAVLEAFRSGRSVDKVYLQENLHDGMIMTIAREARKAGTIISYVPKERLNMMSETGSHQGVIAIVASYQYAEVSDMLKAAKEKGEKPFLFLLDGIEDPHNLGAIIRTANLAGAHGVIITKHRAVGLTATVAKASAGAINYTPVAKVTNLASVIDDLKKEGMWFVCADMGGTTMYDLDLTGPIGLVIGNEGEGVSRLVREKCDYIASVPMKGDIDSLNASVAAGVLAYEIVRQRR